MILKKACVRERNGGDGSYLQSRLGGKSVQSLRKVRIGDGITGVANDGLHQTERSISIQLTIQKIFKLFPKGREAVHETNDEVLIDVQLTVPAALSCSSELVMMAIIPICRRF